MKVRKWMSEFLLMLASRMDAPQHQQSEPRESALVVTPPKPEDVVVPWVRPAEMPAPPKPIQASPRSPEVVPGKLAAYWRAALQHVDFATLRKEKTRSLMQLPLHEVAERATEVDPQEDGKVRAEDVDVVLFLWESGTGGKPGKRRHPLLAVPAVQVEQYLAPRTDAAPVLNPAYLVPEPRGDAFHYADLQQANQLLTQALTELASDKTLKPGWGTWWNISLQVLLDLCEVDDEQSLLQMLGDMADEVSTKETSNGWQLRVATFAGQGSGVSSMKDAYSSYLDAAKTPAVPLFERFCGGEAAAWTRQMPVSLNAKVVGHIDEYDSAKDCRPLFPLDDSQRLAVRAITSLQEGEVQAVNGPPGSGKTSMLRAVVASRWVSAALEQGECPIVVACGATNQSVTNVIEAFGKAPHPDERMITAKRWIDDVPSYGAYFPSSSVLKDESKAAELARFICVTPSRNSGMLWEYHKRTNALDPTRALDMEERYLQYARRALHDRSLTRIESVVRLLWMELSRTVKEGEDFALAAAQGGDRWPALLDRAIEIHVTEFWPNDRLKALEDQRQALIAEPGNVDAAQGIVDLIWRPRAFHLAGRYWEGRFLLAQRERLFSRHPLNVEESLRRLCMLTPCLVSTLHNVANCFRFQVPHGEDPHYTHLLSTVDLLVIDEAGQASPELAGAALLLARRAAVIGDLKQLSPIWNHNDLSEVAIAASVNAFEQINALRQSRRSIADGSVLAAARLVSRWREDDDLGVTLRFHYRCRPSIIGYCNALCYDGKLMPRTREAADSPEPALAWVAIRHDPQKAGGSLYNQAEVEHITSWVAERWPIWQKHTSTKGRPLADIVALITAYRAQSDRLRQGLHAAFARCRSGKGEWPSEDDIDKVTIGTVHKLQGAERPVVCFSLVEGPEHAAGSFIDRDPALLNVAVSRAKTSFIVFGNPQRLFPTLPASGEALQGLASIHALGDYLRRTEQAEVLYPKQLVVIEAGGKRQTLAGILGKTSQVVCTVGALHNLPIGTGVDVAAGLVPRPQWQPNTAAFLAQAEEVMGAVESLVLATDDDRMGEFIAWQVQRALNIDVQTRRIARVRLGSINGPAVRAAFDQPTTMDERKVLAEAAREVVDCLVSSRLLSSRLGYAGDHEQVMREFAACGACTPSDLNAGQLQSVGRVQAAVLRLLLERARECVAQAGKSRIYMTVDIGGLSLTGQVLSLSEQRVLTNSSAAAGIIDRIKDKPLASMGLPVVVSERVEVPRAGTFSVLGEAWRRFRCAPWHAMDALQRLYEGNWANAESVGDFEPEMPVQSQSEDGGHPPITPLDLAAHPETVAPAMVNGDCKALYQVIWDRYELAAEGPYELNHVRLDMRFEGLEKQDLGVRFEAYGCEALNDVQLALLLECGTVANEAEHLITYWLDMEDAPRRFRSESADRWQMTPDQLLAEMQVAHIGRPSTCARSLSGLEDKGLIEMPIQGGQLRLTPSGVATALALETFEPKLTSPAFCGYLSQRLELIEQGTLGPREVLGELLPDLVPDCPDMDDVRGRIWNSLAELEQAQHAAQATSRGGLVSTVNNGTQPA